MSPAPAEHSVQAFQSKNFHVLVGTVALPVLFALPLAKPCPEISPCHMWAQARLTGSMKFECSPLPAKAGNRRRVHGNNYDYPCMDSSRTRGGKPTESG